MSLFEFKKMCCCIGEVVFEALKKVHVSVLVHLIIFFSSFCFIFLSFFLFCLVSFWFFYYFFILAFKGVSVALLHTWLAIFSLHTNC